MAILIGRLLDSGGNTITGDLTIRLNAYRIDVSTSPDSIYYGKPVRYLITNGDIASARRYNDDGSLQTSSSQINLISNNNETYEFSFTYNLQTREYYLQGTLYTGDKNYIASGTNPPVGWYTGAVYNASTSQPLVEYIRQIPTDLFTPFNAKIPNTTNVEWAILTNSGVNAENLDTSIYEISRSTATNFGSQIASAVFIPRGNYSNTVAYPKFSTVYDTGTKKLYWKISDNATAGIPVSSASDWMMILEAPNSVSQTITLLDAAYNNNWDGNTTQALTVNSTYDALQRYALLTNVVPSSEIDQRINVALSNFVAPPTTTAIDQAYSSIGNQIANTRHVNQVIRQYLSLQERRASNANGGQATANNVTRQLNTRVGGVSIGSSWCQEVTASGSVRLTAGRYKASGFGITNRVNGSRIYLFNVTENANQMDIENRLCSGSASFNGTNLANNAASNVISEMRDTEFVLTQECFIQLRQYVQNPGTVTDLGAPSGNSLGGEIYAGLIIEWLANN